MIKKIYKRILKSPYRAQLLPAFSLILLAAGCGKKISNTGSEDKTVKKPGLSSNLIALKVNFGPKRSFPIHLFKLSKDALVTIPDKIQTTLGTPNSYLTKITFNKGNQLEEFYCKYENILDQFSASNSKYINTFKGCFQDTQRDDDMTNDEEQNYFPGQTLPHKSSEMLEFQLIDFKSSKEAEATVNVEVEWF